MQKHRKTNIFIQLYYIVVKLQVQLNFMISRIHVQYELEQVETNSGKFTYELRNGSFIRSEKKKHYQIDLQN